MRVLFSETAIRRKYGIAWSAKILRAAGDLGPMFDVSGKSADEIRGLITGGAAAEANVLLGGYDLIPPFIRPNPSFNLAGDDDETVPTDAPYGAKPGATAEEFVPSHIVARIPDASGHADGADFIKVIRFQDAATTAKTPAKRFERCASEFKLATTAVSKAMKTGASHIVLSPPASLNGAPDVISALSGAGRVHVLLHGANFSPDWAYLWGHGTSGAFIKGMSARQIDLCDLRGAVVTFSSCYAAMLDSGKSEAAHRNEANQVALACLGHGAKFVVASTRSNWISLSGNGDSLGPGLIADVWRQLGRGKRAGDALRAARAAYVKRELATSQATDRPYILKTALQAQLYGNPEARL
jgi:hypothetical protein